jgi:hypothetical protein
VDLKEHGSTTYNRIEDAKTEQKDGAHHTGEEELLLLETVVSPYTFFSLIFLNRSCLLRKGMEG